jgi:beta-glucanase (GH16 family)
MDLLFKIYRVIFFNLADNCMLQTIFLNLVKSTAVILVVIFMLSCKKSNKNISQPVTDSTALPGYTLLWHDEFNGNSVNTANWNFESGTAYNQEEEYYQAANATVANGNLVITAKKESVGGELYTSARLNTDGKFTVQYGLIEARIKFPLGAGMWPAFWMLGANFDTVNWPTCGETDIMEHIDADSTIYGTMHWNVNGPVQYGQTTTIGNPGGYHIYSVQWDANSIRWYVDNNLYVTGNIANNVNGTDAFHLPFFIILNLAVGGTFPGLTVDESKLPASMYVDYVRVYKAN